MSIRVVRQVAVIQLETSSKENKVEKSKQEHHQCKDCAFHRENSDNETYDRCCIEPVIVYRKRSYPCCCKIKLKVVT